MKGATQADATSIIANAMTHARITNYNIAFNPSKKEDVNVSGEAVTVTVTASFANVAWFSPRFFAQKSLRGSCVFPADMNASDGGDTNGYDADSDDSPIDGISRDDDD